MGAVSFSADHGALHFECRKLLCLGDGSLKTADRTEAKGESDF